MASRTLKLYLVIEKYPLLYCMRTFLRYFVIAESGKLLGQGCTVEEGNTLERERFIN